MKGNRILLTAFLGTSGEVLVRNAELDSQCKVLYLPSDKVRDSEILIEALKQEQYDTVISLGQRPNIKDKVHIETRACNAGTSFCNELYWNGLRYIEEHTLNTKMVFLHVPFEKNISDVECFGKKLLTGTIELLS